ncbi:helix-turn-helix transcriptional regulator [Alkalibacter mobilis]|uniref:helix-turn-helix transcriptional regulator n=1 Tax=Alkalibacter mobilis TaxID=2787712 RepID=UPI001A9B089A|nr:helix-turn-helix transcriptional regulator [Alkalibacter mobilis]
MEILDIVKAHQPITSEQIAEKINLTRATLRPDLTILTMIGILEARPKVGYYYSGKSLISVMGSFIKNIHVMDVKSVPVVVSEDTTIYDAIVTMFLEDTGNIYVQNKGFLSGIVSRKDFIKATLGNQDIKSMPVAMIMTRMPNIVYCEQDESIFDAAVKIIDHQVDSLPIVERVRDEKGIERLKIIGKISKTTITNAMVNIGND